MAGKGSVVRKRKYSKGRHIARQTAKYLIVLLVAVIPLIPIWSMYLWLISQSFSEKVILGVLPSGFTIKNWRFLWAPIKMGLVRYPNIWPIVLNSLYLSLGMCLIVVFISSMAGYALSRMEFPGRTQLMEFILALHAFPSIILLVALFVLLNKLGLYGKGLATLTGIMVAKAALEIPMSTWIIKGFFDSIPWDVEWAALVDGCSRFTAWRKVIIPLILPGIGAVAIFSFLSGWSEFILVFTFVTNARYYTLPVEIYHLIGEFRFIDWGYLAAMSLFYAIPTIIFFSVSQKVLLRIYVGGIKR